MSVVYMSVELNFCSLRALSQQLGIDILISGSHLFVILVRGWEATRCRNFSRRNVVQIEIFCAAYGGYGQGRNGG
jgi:hypothetical protein